MKKIIKSIVIVLLLLLGFGATSLLATVTTPSAKDSLVVKQYSIDSSQGEFKEKLEQREGRLTFRILAGYTTGLDADQIRRWIQDGTLQLNGIRFDADRAIRVNEKKLSVPFEFEHPLQEDYLETDLRISGSDWVEDAASLVSLYGGSHGVVDISLIGEGRRMAAGLASSRKVYAVSFDFAESNALQTMEFPMVAGRDYPERESRKGFFLRNRYWVMGAATLVASSTTALIMSGGDSVTYLPEPPGRP